MFSSSVFGPHSPMSAKGMNLHRSFGMGVATFQPLHPLILQSKYFTNPNYVNKHQKDSKQVDSFANSRQKNDILESKKGQCLKAIPNIENTVKPLNVNDKMCHENSTTNKQRKQEHTVKQHNHMGKKSRQNLRRKEISDSMEENPKNFTSSDDGLANTPDIKPHSLVLEDFLVQKPISGIHKVIQQMTQQLPKSKGKEMLVTISVPLARTCQHSFTDSDDSLIIVNHNGQYQGKDNKSEIDELPGRARFPSVCESEDSFIVFEKDDLESLEDDDNDEESNDEDTSEKEDSDVDEVDFSFCILNRKKVRFASNDELCEVHPMIKWSYAYQAARKGPWEMYARDRSRFKERALRVERDIKHIFDSQHRAKIYKERFENL